MRARGSRAGGGRGFTLMEVLLAVVTSSVVLVAVNAIFFGAVRLRNKAEEAVEAARPLHRALAVLRRDLEGLVVPGGTLGGELQTTATTGLATGTNTVTLGSLLSVSVVPVGPEWRTATGVVEEGSPWGEVQRVAYFLAASTNREAEGYDLCRSVGRNLLAPVSDEPWTERLVGGVEALTFQFYDGAEWRETWDSTVDDPKVPLAVLATLTLVGKGSVGEWPEPIEVLVPLVVQARTNAVAAGAGEEGEGGDGGGGDGGGGGGGGGGGEGGGGR